MSTVPSFVRSVMRVERFFPQTACLRFACHAMPGMHGTCSMPREGRCETPSHLPLQPAFLLILPAQCGSPFVGKCSVQCRQAAQNVKLLPVGRCVKGMGIMGKE